MTSDPWPAPVARSPVRAVVTVPGSKSITNRALVIAALADGPGRIRHPLRSRDTELMAGGLRALGVAVIDDDTDDNTDEGAGPGGEHVPGWRVGPAALRGPARVDCGLAGTVMRFLPPVAALAAGAVAFDGDPAARARPMGPMLAALGDLGAVVEGNRLPFTVRGRGGLSGGPVCLDASASSQFVSGLLLAGARYEQGVHVTHTGPPVPSAPHVTMTVQMLAEAGCDVEAGEGRWQVGPGAPRAVEIDVEPDLSNAVAFIAAGLVTGGTVTVTGWPSRSVQPSERILDLLERMGARAHLDADGLTVHAPGRLRGIDVDLSAISELTPTVAALAAVADGPTTVRGVAHIRGHETDRIAALAREINGLGGAVTETSDGLRIAPCPLRGGVFATHGDHRMATAAAIVGLVTPGVTLDDATVTAKTLPDFCRLWQRMLGEAGDAL